MGGWQDDHAETDLEESQRGSRQDAPASRCPLEQELLGRCPQLHGKVKQAPVRFEATRGDDSMVRISTLELPRCEMQGRDEERLAGVLAQCPSLAHLDLSGNYNFGAGGAERLAGVLGQCRELVHLNLSDNGIGPVGAESLAGVLGQCTSLAQLKLSCNKIETAGAESLARVLAQCPALAHLNISTNSICAVGKGRLRASWRGQASGLVL